MNKKFLALLALASFMSTPLSALAIGDYDRPNLNNVIGGSVTQTDTLTNAVVGTGKNNQVGQFNWNTFKRAVSN